jgi:RHS repeat-associated protein
LNAGYQHTDQNRLTSDGVYSYDYDNEGNRTKRTEISTGKVDEYTWDYRNRLTSVVSKNIYGVVTQTVSYEYDVNDLRVKKTVDGVVENYYLDGDNIAFVTDGVGDRTFHYLYGLEADQVLAQDSETGMVWSLADRLGSIDVLTNEQGIIVDQRTYDSFGNTLSQLDPTVKFRFGYTGRESDPETGLYYYRARYFDANVGRFISTDPIGFEAGDSNLYRYVNNSSTLATDPSGKIFNILGGAAIGGFAGGVIGGLYALADDIQSGHLNENTFERVVNGAATGAIAGAVIGSGLAIVGGLAGLAVTAKLVSASTVTATGLVAGAGFSGWQIGGGVYNIANGKPLTGTLDIIGGVVGIKALSPGYKLYQRQLSNERSVRLDIISGKLDSLAEETRATVSSIEQWQASSENLVTIAKSESSRLSTTGRNAGLDFNYRNQGLIFDDSKKIAQIETMLERRYGVKIKFSDEISYGMSDERIGTMILNPEMATLDVIAHEVSHIRFANAMGKWNNGQSLSNFEINLMEAIGYYGSYRKAISSGMSKELALIDTSLGWDFFAKGAMSAIKSDSPNVMSSLKKAIHLYGIEYVEAALRFEDKAIKSTKKIPNFPKPK